MGARPATGNTKCGRPRTPQDPPSAYTDPVDLTVVIAKYHMILTIAAVDHRNITITVGDDGDRHIILA